MDAQTPGGGLRRRVDAIHWACTQIAAYGLTYEDLKAAGCFTVTKRKTATPRSAAEVRERAEAILWIRTQIASLGLSYDQLQAAGCFDSHVRAVRKTYRNAQGQSWDGRGDMPDWLQRAVHAGQSVEHFRVWP